MNGRQDHANAQTREAEERGSWWKPSANFPPHQKHDNRRADETGKYPAKRPQGGIGVVNE